MEVRVQNCESSDFPKKSRSVDLKTVYAEKPWGLDRISLVQKASKGLKGENSSPFEIRRSPTDRPRSKRSRKEASLSSFGPVIIKKRRNGLNSLRLKPDGFSSGVGKPENLSNSSCFGDGLQDLVNDSALDTLKQNNSGTLSIGNSGSSSGLGDGVVIPKKPRGVLRQGKIEKADSRKTVKGGYDRSGGKSTSEPLLNELPSGVASPAQVSDGQAKKKSTEVKDDQSTDVALPSQVSDGQRKKKSTEAKDEQSTNVASHSHVSDGQRKKKSTEAKDELSTDVASHSHVSDGKGKKKCTNRKNESCVGSPSHVADDKGIEKSTDVKNEPQIAVASASHLSDGKRNKKSTDVNKNELFTDVASSSQVQDGKKKKKSNKVKDNGSAKISSIPCIKGDKSVWRSKKNSTTLLREYHLENGTSLADGQEFYVDLLEDDLEQNAARMLSSRFDPSCTGFSGSGASALSKLKNRGTFKASQPESSPVDSAGRMLRPRRRNGKSLVMKRRHFYEVSNRDMDPYCILKQRIRVFWPLDQSWYFGLVRDYDPVTRLHHVKYDDRDEEWINLRNERFKLLLFPSEISGKLKSGKSQLELKQHKKVDKTASDDISSNCTESEPIIAWLIRSKNRRKSSTTNMRKKKRTHLHKDFKPSITLALQGHSCVDPSNLFPKIDETSPEVTSVRSNTIFNDRELSFVYFRKRFHKRRGEGLEKMLEHSLHGSSAASINILASVADNAAVLEELNLFGSSMELKQVRLRSSFQQLCSHDLSFGMEGSLCHALLLVRFGILANVWPMVRMEIVIVDNVFGLRILLFEGSLRCAAVLLCLIIRSFCQHSKRGKFEEMQMPFTSVGINLSGLHDQCGKLLFFLYRFFEMQSSKWRYVEDKLKRQCVTMWEIPLLDFTPSTFKNLQNESGQMLCTSMYTNAASLEKFQERSYPEIIRPITPVNPTVCYIDEKRGRLPPYSLSFSTAPSFCLSLHIKSLIENNTSSVSFEKHNSSTSRESPDSHDKLTVSGCCSPFEDPSDQVSDITVENMGSSLGQVAANSGKLSVGQLKIETGALSMSSEGDCLKSSHNSLGNEVKISGNSVGRQDMELNGSDETVVQIERFPTCTESSQDAEKSSSSFPEGYSSPEKSEGGYGSYMNNANAQVDQIEQSVDKGTLPADSVLDLAWEMNGYSIHSLNPTAPRSARHCNGNSSVSPKYGHYSKSWSEDFMRNGFISGSKKPRTQVSYSLPFGGFDLGSKRRSHHRKPRSYKKIKADDAKRLLGVSANSQSYHGPLTCNANVLATMGDKGWRECGAQVVLESDDQKDWRICVKFSGVTKYAYKAQHILQPGITNRHTHAMMWKGGKDWTLEFTDRSQWSLFKEIHEECFNCNMRAAYVKNIPIPGVRLIADDSNDDIVGVPFDRSSCKYYQQFGTEVDVALDPSHVIYDMDSDDEEWVSEMRNSVDMKRNDISELSDDMFERVMDIFEKYAYAQQCDEFSSDEIEEFMADVGPLDIVKTILEHWRQKRLKKGMALVRQFQPALWVRYQKQLKEWESAMSRMHRLPDGTREKARPIKKPPMFAFCLRPRGLEVPNKLLKQRSHKKFISTTGSHGDYAREHDGFHPSGRRTNGLGDERALVVSIPSYESSDSYYSNDGSERFQSPELPRSISKKRWAFPSPRDPQVMPFSPNKRSKKNGMDPWSPRIYEPSSASRIQRDGLRRNRACIDEFKLRDASSAANHALSMARMKREKAQWLIHKADLALHKATVALMVAEAMKESKEEEDGLG